MSIGPQDNIAAATAVTAIRSPFRNEFLAPETDTSASALSGLCENFDAIDKHNAGNCHLERILSSRAPRRLGSDASCRNAFSPSRPTIILLATKDFWPSNLVAIHILLIVSSPGR